MVLYDGIRPALRSARPLGPEPSRLVVFPLFLLRSETFPNTVFVSPIFFFLFFFHHHSGSVTPHFSSGMGGGLKIQFYKKMKNKKVPEGPARENRRGIPNQSQVAKQAGAREKGPGFGGCVHCRGVDGGSQGGPRRTLLPQSFVWAADSLASCGRWRRRPARRTPWSRRRRRSRR